MRSVAVLAGLILLLATAGAGAQDLDSVLARASYSQPERAAIRRRIELAEARGIDPELLLPRVAEGVAKRAPAELLEEAVASEITRLEAARDLIVESDAAGLVADRPSWLRAANLLDAGFRSETVRRLARASADRIEAFRPGSLLLTLLTEWGLDETAAATLAAATIDSRLATEEFPGLLDLLIAGRARRITPADMTRRLLDALPHVRNLRGLRRAVL